MVRPGYVEQKVKPKNTKELKFYRGWNHKERKNLTASKTASEQFGIPQLPHNVANEQGGIWRKGGPAYDC